MLQFTSLWKKSVVFVALTFICVVVTYGQPNVEGPPNNPGGDPDNPVPITGIEVLLGMGAIFGAKKLNDFRKRNK